MRRVGGYAADAVIAIGSDVVPDDLAANHHRVGGEAADPTWGGRVSRSPMVSPQAALTSVSAAACDTSTESGTAFFTAVISAMIEIAISAGVLLPM